MKPTSGHSPLCAVQPVPPSDVDPDDFKDLYYASTEIEFVRVQQLFEGAGYLIRRAELSPHGLPLAYVRMVRKTAPLIEERSNFRQHVRQILTEAPFWFTQAELDTHQDGRSLVVSFLWERSESIFTDGDLENEFVLLPP